MCWRSLLGAFQLIVVRLRVDASIHEFVRCSMASIPHPIPYQGSKRLLAPLILEHFPEQVHTLYEPFAGSGALSLAAAARHKAKRYVLGDSLTELIDVWNWILDQPVRLADDYQRLWERQHDDPVAFYNAVRDEYNELGGPARLLFLLARCVKNSVRFNRHGEFNQSPDKRRLGTAPERMRKNVLGAHDLLTGKTQALSADYSSLLALATPSDLVYMDPPYQGTSGSRDQRYYQQLDLERFIEELAALRSRGVPFIISFDGRSGTKTYGPNLPKFLNLTRLEIHAGRSAQATLNGADDETYESLYLSPELSKRMRDTKISVSGVLEQPTFNF